MSSNVRLNSYKKREWISLCRLNVKARVAAGAAEESTETPEAISRLPDPTTLFVVCPI